MPRSRTAHGAAAPKHFSDNLYYSEDPHSHSQHFNQPRSPANHSDYIEDDDYGYPGYNMAGQNPQGGNGEQFPTNNEDWQTHLRSCQITGPQAVAFKGFTLTPGMVVTIESRGPTSRIALFSHCSIRALRVHDNSEVSNAGRSVTGVQVAQSSTTVTMEYRFEDLFLEEAGNFYFDICIYGMDTMTSMTPRILVMWGERYSQAITVTE